jgi:hypothetical protein
MIDFRDTSNIIQTQGRHGYLPADTNTSNLVCYRPDSLYSYYPNVIDFNEFLDKLVLKTRSEKETKPDKTHPEPVKVNDRTRILNRLQDKKFRYEIKSDHEELPLIEHPPVTTDWMVIIIMISLASLSWIRMFYGKFLTLTIKSTFNFQASEKFYREQNTLTQRVSFILNIVFIINFSLFICQILHINKLQLFDLEEYTGFFIVFLVIAFLISVKYLIYKFIGYLFLINKLLSAYIHHMSVYNKAYGIILFPVIIGIPFLPDQLKKIAYFAGFLSFIIVYFAQIIRGIKIILYKDISIFYLILYLCTLEILPLLVLYKFILTLL